MGRARLGWARLQAGLAGWLASRPQQTSHGQCPLRRFLMGAQATMHLPVNPMPLSLQGSRPRPDPDAAAGGGPCARWWPAFWRDGARLHHLPRRRRLPQGASYAVARACCAGAGCYWHLRVPASNATRDLHMSHSPPSTNRPAPQNNPRRSACLTRATRTGCTCAPPAGSSQWPT